MEFVCSPSLSPPLLPFCLFQLCNAEISAQEPVSFMKDVLPVLKDNCFACHDAKNHKGKFEMTSYEQLLKGGSRGEAVVPGKSEESLLWTLTSGQEEP